MLRKMCMNVVFLCCVASLLVVAAINYPPLAGAKGVESQGAESLSVPAADQGGVDSYTKLMLHADGSDQGTSFTDSSSGAKTVTNTETYDSYTKLMLHMEGSGNSFTDSATSKAVTANGNAQMDTVQYKLGGRSAVFDGNGDYLSLADSDDWNLGNGDFTIDFWVRFNSLPQTITRLYGQYVDANNYIHIEMKAEGSSNYSFVFRSKSGGSWQYYVQGGNGTFTTGVWYHVAFVRAGQYGRWYQDGVWMAYSLSADATPVPDISAPIFIGAGYGNDGTIGYFDGWLDELRITKGTARWTSNFTPPSSPYGKVYTVTGTKKFGAASGEFKGSGDYLSLADSDDWNFGSGDFTIDFWVRFNTLTGGKRYALVTQYSTAGNFSFKILFLPNSLFFDYSTDGATELEFIFAWTPSTATWYHVAVVRNGSDLKTFVNGVQINSTGNIGTSSLYNSSANLEIGRSENNNNYTMDGWLDELRISKGIARWTSNFTPPSAPYDVDTTPPTVGTTSPASSATGVGVSTAISATFSEDMDSSTITTTTFTLTSSGSSGNSIRQAQDRSVGWVKRSAPNETGDDKDGFASLNPSYTKSAFIPTSSSVSGTLSYSNKTATFTPSSNLSYSTTYTATITTGVKDISGNAMSSNYTWSFTTGAAPDTTAPDNASVSINSGASYTNSTAVTLTLSATDSVGVTAYYLSTSSSTPTASASGWNSVTPATSYSGSMSYTLTSGDEQKTVYVWFKDSAGNVSVSANDSIILDTTAPIVTITSPTSDPYTATSSTVSPSGSASDATSGVKEVTWSSDKGSSGTASGTSYWSISSVSLSTGDNKITVTAKDNAGNTSTDTITVTYSASTKPTVLTGSATNVTATSATLTGTVNANGLSTTAWFEYGTVQGTYGSKSSTQTVTGSNDTTVSSTITGLTAETTYYYRAAAQNNSGTSYGSEMTFIHSSKGSAPTVTTDAATDVTTTTATLNGKVNANGLSTTAWFEYGTVQGSYGSKSNTKAVTGSTDTTVSASISGLTAGTTYYYRIAAQNSVGTSYGTEMSFYYTSQTESPSVTTEAATDVTATTATLNGEVNPNGQSTTVWFEYGVLSGTYKYKTSTQSKSGSSYTKVSASITGLTAGTTYYYRIAAKNSAGTSYGEEMEFYKEPGSTDPTPTPTVTPTLPPSPQLSPTPTPVGSSGSISGDVKDGDGNVLQGVTVTIVGANGRSPLQESAETDASGKYEFTELAKGSYTLTYEKDGYQTLAKNVSLGEGEAKALGSVTLEEEGALGGIYGNVVDVKGDPIESVQIKLKGVRTKVTRTESSDADGYYEFTGLDADTYILTAKKKRYRKFKQTVSLSDGEEKEVEVMMRRMTKKIKGLFLMDDGQ